ncbi:hypothetical protein E2C01_007650 [Portunus trituberculatus]|uniref:Uncharacterized protein n=1 Tax=Portunus trituberculatus TaxID=210409 RepID=A0A5B7D4M8_PORTR|nr:hypothetical protein [Portunus trituberculatus]
MYLVSEACGLTSSSGYARSINMCISSYRPALCQNQDKTANGKSHMEEPEAGISIPASLVPPSLVKPKSLTLQDYKMILFQLQGETNASKFMQKSKIKPKIFWIDLGMVR